MKISLTLPEKNEGHYENREFSSLEAARKHIISRLSRASKWYWGRERLENELGKIENI